MRAHGKMQASAIRDNVRFNALVAKQLVEERIKQITYKKADYKKNVKEYNAWVAAGLERELDEGGYSINDKEYHKNILSKATFWGEEHKDITIGAYKDYVLEARELARLDITIQADALVSKTYYEHIMERIDNAIGSIQDDLYGEETDKYDGAIEKHAGKRVKIGEGKVADIGSGERGRILSKYYEGAIEKAQ